MHTRLWFERYAPNHIFGIGKDRQFKFRVLIDAQEYCACVIPKGVYPESCDLFKFWEISDNISLTVQDSDIET